MVNLLFQYCPKLAVFSEDESSVLLCRRQDEADYDGVFSFIGGKMEHADASIAEALHREKTEEVGENFRVEVIPHFTVNIFFVKNNGSRMILPHHYARHVSGEPNLNAEYSEYRWVPLDKLEAFGPKISNVSWIADLLLKAGQAAPSQHFVRI